MRQAECEWIEWTLSYTQGLVNSDRLEQEIREDFRTQLGTWHSEKRGIPGITFAGEEVL